MRDFLHTFSDEQTIAGGGTRGLTTHLLNPTVTTAAAEIQPSHAKPGDAWRGASPGAIKIVRRRIGSKRGEETQARRRGRVIIMNLEWRFRAESRDLEWRVEI